MPFKPTDFFAADEQSSLSDALVNGGSTDTLQSIVDEQDQKVTDYATKYLVDPKRRKRLVRSLVFFEVYAKVGPIPDQHTATFNAAMKELEAIRDGKFPDLLVQTPVDPSLASAPGRWGSKRKY